MVIAVVAAVAGVLLLLAVGCCCCCVWRKRRKRQGETGSSAPGGGADDVLPIRVRKHPALDEDWRSAEKDVDLPLFDLDVVLTATDNFALHNKIGEGGFGPVYMVRTEPLTVV